jgi:hypothetical protein
LTARRFLTKQRSLRVALVGDFVRVVATPHVAVAVVLTLLLGFPFGGAVAAATSERAEIFELRTATSKTFRNGNGTFSTVLFANPVHFKTDAGKWSPIRVNRRGAPPSRLWA